MLQQPLSNLGVSLVELSADSSEGLRACLVCNDDHEIVCNKLLIIRFLKCEADVQDCLHEIHKREVTAPSCGHLVIMFVQLELLCPNGCSLVF